MSTLTLLDLSINRIILHADPEDNKFLACALEGNADFIVSKDAHLRNIKQFHGIKIIDVKSFLEKL